MIRGLQKLQKSKYNLNLRCYIMCVCDDFAKTNSRCEVRVIIIFAQVLHMVVQTAQKQSETIGSIIPFPIASTPPKMYQKPG